MNFFNRNTKVKHIKTFETQVLEIIKTELPKMYEASTLVDLIFVAPHYADGIPSGLTLLHQFKSDKAYRELKKNYRSHFYVHGVLVWNKKAKDYLSIRLRCLDYLIQGIEVDDPTRFHKNYDLGKIKMESIKIENISTAENPDLKVVKQILNELEKSQLDLLELDHTFEFEDDGKTLYPIIDMEDGNCIAVDENGIIYRWHHDSHNRLKKIADNPTKFFEYYHGRKSDLEAIMNE